MTPTGNEKVAFAVLAQEVFALDTAILWFVLEKAGREPFCARRDAGTGRVSGEPTTPETELVDPLVLLLAEGRDGIHAREDSRNPHRLLFVVLVYPDFVEIVARFGQYDRAGVGVSRHTDAYTLGRKLTELLDRKTKDLFAGTRRCKCSNTIAPRCFGLCSRES
jgi:hypothetical protein